MIAAFGSFALDRAIGVLRSARVSVLLEGGVTIALARSVLGVPDHLPVDAVDAMPIAQTSLDRLIVTSDGLRLWTSDGPEPVDGVPTLSVEWGSTLSAAIRVAEWMRVYPEITVDPATRRYLQAVRAMAVSMASHDLDVAAELTSLEASWCPSGTADA